MTTVTKPYQDFVNNVDVIDATKINAQYNALYNFLNAANIDFTNLAAAIYSMNSVASTLVERDASQNIAYNFSKSGQNANLLFNPSFRLGSAGWAGVGVNGFSTVFSTSGDGGNLQTATSTGASSVNVTSTKIPTVASLPLTLSGDVNTSGVTAGTILLVINAYSNTDVFISGVSVTIPNGTSWAKYSTNFTTPANTSYVNVQCYVGPNTTLTFAAWRKLKLESGSIATTFSDDNTLNTLQYGSVLGLAQVLSGGYKTQSGSSSVVIASAGVPVQVVVTFPVAFTAAPTVAIGMTGVTVGDSGYIIIRTASKTATSITFTVNSYVAQTVSFDYTAQGT